MTQPHFDELDGLAQQASRGAIAEAHAHMLPVTLGRQDGAIYRLFPDGHEEVVTPAPASGTQKGGDA